MPLHVQSVQNLFAPREETTIVTLGKELGPQKWNRGATVLEQDAGRDY
jgi:hypothetical protein